MTYLPESVLEEKTYASPLSLVGLKARSDNNDHTFYDEAHFRHTLKIERMRTERSKKPFILLLVDISKLAVEYDQRESLTRIKTALVPSLREIDIRGWYHHYRTIGIIITEIVAKEELFAESLIRKIYDRFCDRLDPDWMRNIEISYHRFPEVSGASLNHKTFNNHLYPDLTQRNSDRTFSLAVKKAMDLLGSAFALLLLAPLFVIIAAAIKATSRGSVFFKQERVGQDGKTFNMLKFRSMKADCDSALHHNYIKKYICQQDSASVEPGVFKLTQDSRITPIGRFLRKTSLDELPQFINVLRGQMSLVGPRPPLPYECELYNIWHRRRLLSCKPGITGLWQVMGRSRTTFDDMVRLDLKYIRNWSLGLDIKILLMTPKAVVSGSGAL